MNNKKLHIVFVTRELGINKNTGGIGTYVWDLAKSIVKGDNDVTIITEKVNNVPEEFKVVEGVNIIFLESEKPYNPYLNPYKYWTEFRRYRKNIADTIKKLHENKKIDIIEFPEFRAENFMCDNSIPTIIRWHTPLGNEISLRKIIYYPIGKIIRYLEIKSLKKAKCITFPSDWMKKKVEEVIQIQSTKKVVIPNGINIDEWDFKKGKNVFRNTTESEINIVYAGTLIKRKGIRDIA